MAVGNLHTNSVKIGRVVPKICNKKVKVAHTRLPSVYRVPELMPVIGSQPAGDASHKPGCIGCHYFPPGR